MPITLRALNHLNGPNGSTVVVNEITTGLPLAFSFGGSAGTGAITTTGAYLGPGMGALPKYATLDSVYFTPNGSFFWSATIGTTNDSDGGQQGIASQGKSGDAGSWSMVTGNAGNDLYFSANGSGGGDIGTIYLGNAAPITAKFAAGNCKIYGRYDATTNFYSIGIAGPGDAYVTRILGGTFPGGTPPQGAFHFNGTRDSSNNQNADSYTARVDEVLVGDGGLLFPDFPFPRPLDEFQLLYDAGYRAIVGSLPRHRRQSQTHDHSIAGWFDVAMTPEGQFDRDLLFASAAPATNDVAETSAGSSAQDRAVALSAAAAETSLGDTTQDRAIAVTGAAAESSSGDTTQDRAIAITGAAAESSAGSTSQDGSVAVTGAAAESSAGTTAQDRSVPVTGAAAESSAGDTAQDRSIAVTGSAAESSTGSTAQDGSLAVTGAAAESSVGDTAQDRTVTLAGAAAESSAGTTAQDYAGGASFGTTESSAGDTVQNRSMQANAAGAESSAGSTAQDRTAALSAAAAESAAGTDDENRTVSLTGAAAESSAGTDTQSGTMSPIGASVAESSSGDSAQDRTIALGGNVAESATGSTAQDFTAPGVFGTVESSAGDTVQNRSVTLPGTNDVAEASTGSTAQDRVIAPTGGSASSGVRRWIEQFYLNYFARKKKDPPDQIKTVEHIQPALKKPRPAVADPLPPQQDEGAQAVMRALAEQTARIVAGAAERERIIMFAKAEAQAVRAMTEQVLRDRERAAAEEDEEDELLLLSGRKY